jgi:hypothetical protein
MGCQIISSLLSSFEAFLAPGWGFGCSVDGCTAGTDEFWGPKAGF